MKMQKNMPVYILGFVVFQIILISAVFVVDKTMAPVWIFLVLSFVICITLVGDYCLAKVIQGIIQFNDEEIELKHMMEMNKKNYQFYQFAMMQQKNIRHFYHDLNNHLITVEILKKDRKEEELQAYSEKILEHYRQSIPEYHSGNVMLDILVHYFHLSESHLDLRFEGEIPENIDFSRLLEVLQRLEDILSERKIVIRLDNPVQLTFPSELSESEEEKLKLLQRSFSDWQWKKEGTAL